VNGRRLEQFPGSLGRGRGDEETREEATTLQKYSADARAPAKPPLTNENKPSRWTARRHRDAQAAAQRCECPEQGLPVEHTRNTKVTPEERYHYEAHRRRHLEAFPDYDAGWRRPSPETAHAVYDLVRGFVPSLDKIHPNLLTATQLVTVALDVAVVSGRYGYRVTEHTDDADKRLRQIRRAVTRNTLSDAIMRRWSDHARRAREQTRAYSVTQMTETAARTAGATCSCKTSNSPCCGS
jgi:hypothetical protein